MTGVSSTLIGQQLVTRTSICTAIAWSAIWAPSGEYGKTKSVYMSIIVIIICDTADVVF